MPWQWTSNQQQPGGGGWGPNAWNSRDHGKGKGKGKGKEEPSGRKWPCPSAKCKEHNKGVALLMLPHLKACTCCLTPKSVAPAVEQASLLKLREEAKKELEVKAQAPLSKRKQKLAKNAETKRLAEEKTAADKAAPKAPAAAAAPGLPTPPNDAEAKDEWAPKALPSSTTTEVGKLKDIVDRVLESVAMDSYPAPKTPGELEAEITSKLAPLQPAFVSTEAGEVEKELADLNALILMGAHRMPEDVYTDLGKRVEAKEAQLTRLTKKAQPPALKHANLVQAKAAAATACTQRSERAKSGAAKAATRSADRLQLITAGIEALTRLQQAVQVHDQAFAQAHAARSLVVDSSEQALLLKYDTQITLALRDPNGPLLEAEDDEFLDAAATDAAAEELAEWKGKFKELQERQAKEAESMQAQLEALQATHSDAMAAQSAVEAASKEAAAAAAEEARKAAAEAAAEEKKALEARATEHKAETAAKTAWAVTTTAFEATVVCDSSKLPDYLPDDQALEHCSNLFYLLQHWSLAGGSLPFCLGDLRNEATAKKGTDDLVKALLGPLLKTLFPSGATGQTIFSRQAVLILLHALERLKARFERVEETRKAAADCYAVIVELSKKRRTSGQ